MNRRLVSCIIPVWNGERFLAEALDSIFAQSHSPIEVIVVDDGSTDRTGDVAAADGRGVRLVSQQNAGPAAARNHGMRVATGDFFAFLDHDDIWLAEKLSRQLAAFEASPELGACVTHIQSFTGSVRDGTDVRQDPVPGYVTDTMLVSRAAFDRVGPFDENVAHAVSTDWFIRARELEVAVELLADVLVLRRLHETNRSSIFGDRSRQEFLRVMKRNLDRRRAAAAKT